MIFVSFFKKLKHFTKIILTYLSFEINKSYLLKNIWMILLTLLVAFAIFM